MEENLFNQLANKYDTLERKELAKIIAGEIKTELKKSKNQTLLDYGCGTGLVGLELAARVERLILMDSSEQMLEITKKKIEKANLRNAEAIDSDFTKTGSDTKADIILVSLVLLHIPATQEILSQFYSALHPQGKLMIVDFDKNENINHPKVHNGFDHSNLKSLLTDAGFHSTEIRTFYHGKNIFMNRDASLFLSISQK